MDSLVAFSPELSGMALLRDGSTLRLRFPRECDLDVGLALSACDDGIQVRTHLDSELDLCFRWSTSGNLLGEMLNHRLNGIPCFFKCACSLAPQSYSLHLAFHIINLD